MPAALCLEELYVLSAGVEDSHDLLVASEACCVDQDGPPERRSQPTSERLGGAMVVDVACDL